MSAAFLREGDRGAYYAKQAFKPRDSTGGISLRSGANRRKHLLMGIRSFLFYDAEESPTPFMDMDARPPPRRVGDLTPCVMIDPHTEYWLEDFWCVPTERRPRCLPSSLRVEDVKHADCR